MQKFKLPILIIVIAAVISILLYSHYKTSKLQKEINDLTIKNIEIQKSIAKLVGESERSKTEINTKLTEYSNLNPKINLLLRTIDNLKVDNRILTDKLSEIDINYTHKVDYIKSNVQSRDEVCVRRASVGYPCQNQ